MTDDNNKEQFTASPITVGVLYGKGTWMPISGGIDPLGIRFIHRCDANGFWEWMFRSWLRRDACCISLFDRDVIITIGASRSIHLGQVQRARHEEKEDENLCHVACPKNYDTAESSYSTMSRLTTVASAGN